MVLPQVWKQSRILSQGAAVVKLILSGEIWVFQLLVRDRKGKVAVEILGLIRATEKIHVDRGRPHVVVGGLSRLEGHGAVNRENGRRGSRHLFTIIC